MINTEKAFYTDKVLFAVQLATLWHDGQRRKYEDEPYILHPIRVARHVAKLSYATQDMIIGAILHDTVEDCPGVTLKDIDDNFGGTVVELVHSLTDEKPYKGGPNRAKRKANSLQRLSVASPEAQTIKCADLIDNVHSIVRYDKDFGPLFVSEAKTLMLALTKAEPLIHDELFGALEYAEKMIHARKVSI